jgi:hypothetical protein
MMGTEDRVINDYLNRLEGAAQVLAPDRRRELLAGIREHIDSARADGVEGEAATLALLERLGSPEEIVASAAAEGDPGGYDGRRPKRRSLVLETVAVLFMTVGSFIPVLGWLVGVVLMWVSDRWTTREKWLGTLVIPGGLGTLMIIGLFVASGESVCGVSSSSTSAPIADSCAPAATSWWDHVAAPVTVVLLIAAFAVPFYLLNRARIRATAERANS